MIADGAGLNRPLLTNGWSLITLDRSGFLALRLLLLVSGN